MEGPKEEEKWLQPPLFVRRLLLWRKPSFVRADFQSGVPIVRAVSRESTSVRYHQLRPPRRMLSTQHGIIGRPVLERVWLRQTRQKKQGTSLARQTLGKTSQTRIAVWFQLDRLLFAKYV